MAAAIVIGVVAAAATAAALAWKWGLPMGLVALATAALALVPATACAMLAAPAAATAPVVWATALVLAGGMLAYRFYRDPDRTPPDRDDVVVSPADGHVLYVRRSERGRVPAATKGARDHALDELTHTPMHLDEAIVVGIGLSFLDVHVNRSPVAGRVRVERHRGGFASLRRPEAALENERATLVVERPALVVGVVLIASRLVRRVVTYVHEGEQVALGQRIGMIRFGSQVDVVLPLAATAEVRVEPGERVRAGETIVAVLARQGVET
jgi:phosphatidylserine decarboxylase